jgi:hypothetical protein
VSSSFSVSVSSVVLLMFLSSLAAFAAAAAVYLDKLLLLVRDGGVWSSRVVILAGLDSAEQMDLLATGTSCILGTLFPRGFLVLLPVFRNKPLPVRVRGGVSDFCDLEDCDLASFGVVDFSSLVLVLVLVEGDTELPAVLEVFVLVSSSSKNKHSDFELAPVLPLLLSFTGMLRFRLMPRPLGVVVLLVPLVPKEFRKLVRCGDKDVFGLDLLVLFLVMGGVEWLPTELFVPELTLPREFLVPELTLPRESLVVVENLKSPLEVFVLVVAVVFVLVVVWWWWSSFSTFDKLSELALALKLTLPTLSPALLVRVGCLIAVGMLRFRWMPRCPLVVRRVRALKLP